MIWLSESTVYLSGDVGSQIRNLILVS
uniref:Uncharacterized protein n=1 Tax=Rhizophora mucronata TaxID=61149 RepID=A0A2P2N663_RHIMU